jgi:hypothetical protein
MPDRAGRIPRQASPVVARPFIYRLVRRSIELLGVHRLNDTGPAPGGVPGVAPKCCSGVGLDREQCHPGSGTDSEGTDQPPGRIQRPLTIAVGPFIGVRSYPGTLPTSGDSRSVVKTDCVSYSHPDHRGATANTPGFGPRIARPDAGSVWGHTLAVVGRERRSLRSSDSRSRHGVPPMRRRSS